MELTYLEKDWLVSKRATSRAERPSRRGFWKKWRVISHDRPISYTSRACQKGGGEGGGVSLWAYRYKEGASRRCKAARCREARAK